MATPTLQGLPVECRLKIIDYVLQEEKPTIHVTTAIDYIEESATGKYQTKWRRGKYMSCVDSVESTAFHPLLHVASQIRAETLDKLRVDLFLHQFDNRQWFKMSLLGDYLPGAIRDIITTITIEEGRIFGDCVTTKKDFPRLELLAMRTYQDDSWDTGIPGVSFHLYDSFLRGSCDKFLARGFKAVAEENHIYSIPRVHCTLPYIDDESNDGDTSHYLGSSKSTRAADDKNGGVADASRTSRGFSLHYVQKVHVDFIDTGEAKRYDITLDWDTRTITKKTQTSQRNYR